MKVGQTYASWLKSWRRRGSPKWPGHLVQVWVKWTDAAAHEDGDEAEPQPGLLSGLVIDADEKRLKVAQEIFTDRTSRQTFAVPAGMVDHVIEIVAIPTEPFLTLEAD